MIRCLIIDPDPAARKALSRELSHHERFSIGGMYGHPGEVPFPIGRLSCDVLFIEVALPGRSGLDYIRSMENPPVVVITTAYREYAVECFELDITDYLVKPVEPARLLKTLSKIERTLDERKKYPPSRTERTAAGQEDFLFIRADKKQVKLYFADILFVESFKDYICIHTVAGQYVIHQTLSGFTAALPQDKFLRVHRSYTVALPWIESLSGASLHLGGREIPIGRNYLAQARKRILGD